ncbi:cupin domain-containing protein [Caballeronia sp. dw_276]|jgi:quercetin dioxygenase-like cupin family protein|uniref:cupin domain-containing protein n=1 Tax=Caballeronia sp. dw_276 TaxID=2719795 RepID=UPI001BD47E33|nr:cupin domain-containing protein [Caballeronia sp. dw_276]
MFVLNTQAPEYNFAGTRIRLLISGKDTAGVFCMMEIFGPPHRATPLHVHDREEETITVLEGVVDITIDGEQVSVRAGETALLPRNVPHRLANNTDQPSRYMLVCTPAGFDDFVDTCAHAETGPVTPTAPGPEDIRRMIDAAPRFGITLLPG